MADFDPNETFEIADYDPNWPAMFEEECARIGAALGDHVIEFEHIGSTSVPGMPAKPIIDILMVVEAFQPVAEYKRLLYPLGYQMYEHEDFNIADHLFMWRGVPRTHHLHIVEYATWEHHRYLLFRDYLRTHQDVAEQYADVKRQLTREYKLPRPAYTKGKTAFIKSITAFALEEITDPAIKQLAADHEQPKRERDS